MKRRWVLGLVASLVAASFVPARADQPASTGFVFEPSVSGMQLPLSATHSEWPDAIVAMEGDGTRLHSIWSDVGGVPGDVYRSSSDGVTWSAPEAFPSRIDVSALSASPDGTVFAIGGSMRLARRDPSSGSWGLSSTPVDHAAFLVQMARAPDGRLWVVYTPDAPWVQSRSLMSMSRDPVTGAWSTPEQVATLRNDVNQDLVLAVISDGTPWVASTSLGASVSVFHRTSSGWVSETPVQAGSAVSEVGAVALGARADGSLLMSYWDMENLGEYALMWATRDASGWTQRGSVLGRTSMVVGRGRIVLAPNGDNVVMWEESRASRETGYRVASRLSAPGVWAPAVIVGSYPRGMRESLSLAVAKDGHAVLAGGSVWIYSKSGGVIASERLDGTWSDESVAGPAVTVDGALQQRGIEFAAAPEDSRYVAWWQETGDGLGVTDSGRTPHIGFSIRDASGAWSSPEAVDVATPWRPAWLAQAESGVAGVASNADGAVYVLWRDIYAAPDMTLHERMVGRYRATSGVWSGVERLPITWTTPGGKEYRPQMAFDAMGALWVMDPYGEEVRRAPDGDWTREPSLVAGSALLLNGLRMAVAPDGTQYAQYDAGTQPGGGTVLLSQRAPGGAWSTPERVDSGTPTARASGALVVINHTLVSGWSEQVSNSQNPYAWHGMVATRALNGGPWGSPKTLGTEGGTRITDIAAMRDGSWWVLYQRCARKDDGNTDCTFYPGEAAIRAVRRTPDGRWQPPVFVSATGSRFWGGGVDDSEPPHIVGDHQPLVVWGVPDWHDPWLGPTVTLFSIGHADVSVQLTSSDSAPRAGDCVTATLSVVAPDGHGLSMLEVAWLTSPVVWSGGDIVLGGTSQARFCPTKAGPVTISVIFSQGTPAVSKTVTWTPGDPASIRLSAPSSPEVGTSQSIRVTVVDKYGNPVSTALAWEKVSGPGRIDDAPAQTGSTGTAVGRVSSEQSGEMAVEVSVPGTDVRASAIISWQPGPAAALRFVDPPSTAPTGSAVSLRVRSVDRFGNDAPEMGLVVTWSSSGQGALVGVPVTDGWGETSARGTSVLAGDSVITAVLRSSDASVSTTLEWV